jgi:hypothetical protein
MEWDEEAQAYAYQQAQQLERRDPEAAAFLMAQLVVTREYQRKRREALGLPAWEQVQEGGYDYIALYAYMVEKTGWTHAYLDAGLHYLDFFAYLAAFQERDRRRANANAVYSPAARHAGGMGDAYLTAPPTF